MIEIKIEVPDDVANEVKEVFGDNYIDYLESVYFWANLEEFKGKMFEWYDKEKKKRIVRMLRYFPDALEKIFDEEE